MAGNAFTLQREVAGAGVLTLRRCLRPEQSRDDPPMQRQIRRGLSSRDEPRATHIHV